MRISVITNKFVDRKNCSGAYMLSRWNMETKTQSLTYRLDGRPIADIYDFKDSKNYRLRIWAYPDWSGRTAHNNRLYNVLQSVQMPNGRDDWEKFRYSTYIRYALKVWDRKLSAEYELRKDAPMEFIFKDGSLVLDYKHFESFATPTASTPEPIALDENSNLQTVSNKLNAILAGV